MNRLSPSLRAQVLIFPLIRVIFNTAYRMVYPFLSVFGRGLGVDLAAFSLLLTARSFTGLASPLLAPIADQRGRKVSMLLGLGLFTVSAGGMAVWPSYPAFFLCLLGCTLGTYIFLPAMQAYLGDRIPYEQRGFSMAITELSWSLSFIAGVPLMGLLIAQFGWTSVFPALTFFGLAGMLTLWQVVPNDTPAKTSAAGRIWQSLGEVLTTRSALMALAFSFLLTSANECVNLVFGVWMETAFGIKIAALAAASAVIGLSELGGESLSAWLADRVGKERAVAAGIALNALSALALPWLGSSLTGGMTGLFLFYLTFEFSMVCCLPLLSELLPRARASVMAANVMAFSLGRAFGAVIAPVLFLRGFGFNAGGAVLLDALALLALSQVRLKRASKGDLC